MAEKKNCPLDMDALKAQYGDKLRRINVTVEPDDDSEVELEYIFRRPTAASYDRFIKTAQSGMLRATRAFLADSVIPEQADALNADMEEYPALAMSISEKLLVMMGLAKNVNLMKL